MCICISVKPGNTDSFSLHLRVCTKKQLDTELVILEILCAQITSMKLMSYACEFTKKLV